MTPFTDFFSIILPTVKLKLGEENEDASEASIRVAFPSEARKSGA